LCLNPDLTKLRETWVRERIAVDNICNDVAKNLALFGLASQKQPYSKDIRPDQNSTRLKHSTNPNAKSHNGLLSSYESLVGSLQSNNEIRQKQQLADNRNGSENDDSKSLMENIFSDQTNPQARPVKAKKRVEESFNVLGLFRPGEFLNKISQNDAKNGFIFSA